MDRHHHIRCKDFGLRRLTSAKLTLLLASLLSSFSCVQERSPTAAAAKAAKQEAPAGPAPDAAQEPVDLIESKADLKQEEAQTFDTQIRAPDERPAIVAQAESQLTRRYRERLVELEEAHAKLRRKDTELSAASKQMMDKLEKLTALEDRLQHELGIGKARREFRDQRTTALASLMMTMPPQSGARILSNMSEQDAQDIVLAVAQKNERKAAKILAQMPPERVASLSQRYLSAKRKIEDVKGLLPPTTSTTPPSP